MTMHQAIAHVALVVRDYALAWGPGGTPTNGTSRLVDACA